MKKTEVTGPQVVKAAAELIKITCQDIDEAASNWAFNREGRGKLPRYVRMIRMVAASALTQYEKKPPKRVSVK